jgi:hypothetical protein
MPSENKLLAADSRPDLHGLHILYVRFSVTPRTFRLFSAAMDGCCSGVHAPGVRVAEAVR